MKIPNLFLSFMLAWMLPIDAMKELSQAKKSSVPSLQNLAAKAYATRFQTVPENVPREVALLIRSHLPPQLRNYPPITSTNVENEYLDARAIHDYNRIKECIRFVSKMEMPDHLRHVINPESFSRQLTTYDEEKSIDSSDPPISPELRSVIREVNQERINSAYETNVACLQTTLFCCAIKCLVIIPITVIMLVEFL